MSLRSLIYYLTGYVELLIRGPQLEKFINLASNAGLSLWDIRRVGAEVMQIKMQAGSFLQTRNLVKRSKTNVKVLKKVGFVFMLRRIWKRKFFLIGALLCLGLLVYLSNFVWVIQIEGFEGAARERLYRELNHAGLRRGIKREKLLNEKRLIEQEVLIHTKQAVWLGITIRGVVAEVRVIERKSPPAASAGNDLIALREGVITKLVVVRGTPVVKEGDSVARGDLLISGLEWHTDKATGALVQENIPAQGVVVARVWYDWEILEPKVFWKIKALKVAATDYAIRYRGKLWHLFGIGKKPDQRYHLSRWRKVISLGRNPSLNVEVIKDVWSEATYQRYQRPLVEVKRAAWQEFLAKSRLLKHAHGERSSSWSDEGGFLKLNVSIEGLQDIAMKTTK